MRRATVVLCVFGLLTACAEVGGDDAATTSPSVEARAPVATIDDFARDAFSRSAVVDNDWFPLRPGQHYIYEGEFTEDGERLAHSVVMTVTDLTKVVNGVETIAIIDRDYIGDELVEYELAFFAQDDAGNVWLMGEYPEEYDDGKFEGAPDTWLGGVMGAQAGIMMRARPEPDTSSYFQGLWERIEFQDKATVLGTRPSACKLGVCYEDVLLIREGNPDEPQAFQLKYYARHIGNVLVGWSGAKEEEREVLALVHVQDLEGDEMAAIRDEAYELERRAYEVSKAVYGRTDPLQPMS